MQLTEHGSGAPATGIHPPTGVGQRCLQGQQTEAFLLEWEHQELAFRLTQMSVGYSLMGGPISLP